MPHEGTSGTRTHKAQGTLSQSGPDGQSPPTAPFKCPKLCLRNLVLEGHLYCQQEEGLGIRLPLEHPQSLSLYTRHL